MIKEQARMIRLLDALIPNVKIYLFGSRARGTHTERSDIDLALDAGRKLDITEVAQARNVLDVLYIPRIPQYHRRKIFNLPAKLRVDRNFLRRKGH